MLTPGTPLQVENHKCPPRHVEGWISVHDGCGPPDFGWMAPHILWEWEKSSQDEVLAPIQGPLCGKEWGCNQNKAGLPGPAGLLNPTGPAPTLAQRP